MKAFLIEDDFEKGDCVNCPCDCGRLEENCPLYEVEFVNSGYSIDKDNFEYFLDSHFLKEVKDKVASNLGRHLKDGNLLEMSIKDNSILKTIDITARAIVIYKEK